MKTFHVEVITPERTVFEGEVSSLRAPAIDGGLGVLANHAPLLTPLSIGEVRLVRPDKKQETLMVAEGFLEVESNKVRILADVSEHEQAIDQARAKRAEERAREELRRLGLAEVDETRARAALSRALVRQKICERLNGGSEPRS